MNNDYYLLTEALETFQKVRSWSDPNFYREQVMPTVNKIRERLAEIDAEKFLKTEKKKFETLTLEDISNLGLFNDAKKNF